MQALWREVQETTLTRSDYYLTRSVERPELAAVESRNAARILDQYLSFFEQYATPELREGVPESAYFAAFEASKGLGEAYLSYTPDATGAEVALAVQRYRDALTLFPFDRRIWPTFTSSLSRHGRESEYRELVRPVAERVLRSPAIESWIENGEPAAESVRAVRQAMSDSLGILYLGFASASRVEERELELSELEADRLQLTERLADLTQTRDDLLSYRDADVPAAPARDVVEEEQPSRQPELRRIAQDIATTRARFTRVEEQIQARSRALPLYRATLVSDGLARELRERDDHPLHTLLRRMYYEDRL